MCLLNFFISSFFVLKIRFVEVENIRFFLSGIIGGGAGVGQPTNQMIIATAAPFLYVNKYRGSFIRNGDEISFMNPLVTV